MGTDPSTHVTALVAICNRMGYDAGSMIKSFRHKGLAELFSSGNARKVQAKHAKRLQMILTMLNVATRPNHMNAPGLRLHSLKGKLEGYFAVHVDENFRVVFRFEDAHVVEVDYVDYH